MFVGPLFPPPTPLGGVRSSSRRTEQKIGLRHAIFMLFGRGVTKPDCRFSFYDAHYSSPRFNKYSISPNRQYHFLRFSLYDFFFNFFTGGKPSRAT